MGIHFLLFVQKRFWYVYFSNALFQLKKGFIFRLVICFHIFVFWHTQKASQLIVITTTCPKPDPKVILYSGDLQWGSRALIIVCPYNEHPYHKSDLMPWPKIYSGDLKWDGALDPHCRSGIISGITFGPGFGPVVINVTEKGK